MKIENIIEDIVLMPKIVERSQHVSFLELLTNSGYCSHAKLVTVSDLMIEIEKQPEIVEDWLAWSDNKRTDSGWFIRIASGGGEVGYYPVDSNRPTTSYSSLVHACANFIKVEIDEICKSVV